MNTTRLPTGDAGLQQHRTVQADPASTRLGTYDLVICQRINPLGK